jgi:hypothetical protein
MKILILLFSQKYLYPLGFMKQNYVEKGKNMGITGHFVHKNLSLSRKKHKYFPT